MITLNKLIFSDTPVDGFVTPSISFQLEGAAGHVFKLDVELSCFCSLLRAMVAEKIQENVSCFFTAFRTPAARFELQGIACYTSPPSVAAAPSSRGSVSLSCGGVVGEVKHSLRSTSTSYGLWSGAAQLRISSM